MKKKSILVVDDDVGILETLKDVLESFQYDVKVENDSRNVIRDLSDSIFDVVIMDMRMPNMNGVEIFRRMIGTNMNQKVIFMTGYCDDDDARFVTGKGSSIIYKPFNIDALERLIDDP
jgi:DNA-binding NtrC family response regulator